MEPISLTPATRYPELDALRFLASLAVVLMHFTYSMPLAAHIGPTFGLLGQGSRYGYLAVDLFFMISGFVVLKSARNKSLSEFFVARVTRLYPVFWLSCVLTFSGLYFGGMGGVSIKQFLFNLTMLHEFFGYASINGVYWSLTYELTFCFLIALLIGCRLWPHVFLVVAGWLAYTVVAGPLPANHLFSYLFIPKHSPYFIAGMLFYLLQARTVAGWPLHAALGLAFGLALRSDRAERHLAQQFFHEALPHNAFITATVIALFFLAFYAIVWQKLRLPPHPIWAGLGQLTYPLYLLHPIGAVPLGLLGSEVNKYLLLGGTLALVLLLAWAAHVFVERPGSRALGRKLNQLIAWLARQPLTASRNKANIPPQ